MSADGWQTCPDIASRLGLAPVEVERAAIQTGVSRSSVHARDSEIGRAYSPEAVLLIERELRAQAHDAARRAKPSRSRAG